MALSQQHSSRIARGSTARTPVVARPSVAAAAPSRSSHVARATAAPAEARFIPRWPQVYQAVKAKRLETVAPQDAARAVESGEWVLIDVRLADQFGAAAPKGAVNVPLYRKIDLGGGFDAKRLLKTVMYRFNGVDPIEPNEEFVADVTKAAEGGKGVIFACEAGGTLTPSINFPLGKASRSLQACYKALEDGGMDKVKHLERGIFGWYQASLDFEGDYKPDIGRFPSSAVEPKLEGIKMSRGYDVRPGDRKD